MKEKREGSLVGNLVSPLLDGLDDLLDNRSLSNGLDGGKGVVGGNGVNSGGGYGVNSRGSSISISGSSSVGRGSSISISGSSSVGRGSSISCSKGSGVVASVCSSVVQTMGVCEHWICDGRCRGNSTGEDDLQTNVLIIIQILIYLTLFFRRLFCTRRSCPSDIVNENPINIYALYIWLRLDFNDYAKGEGMSGTGFRREREGGGRQLNAKVVITEINKAVSNTSSEAFND